MKSLVDWLITVEYRAHDIYARASEMFREHETLAPFLRDLASDELCHVQFMKNAALVLDEKSLEQSPLVLDEQAREQIEAPFARAEEHLARGKLSLDELVDCIINTEFSEWNDIHLFVMTKLQEHGPFFMRMAAAVEQHRRYIGQVLGTLPGARERLEAYNRLPHVWREHILIVDDAPSITRMLSAVCRDLGAVTVAGNGEEALRKIGENYYDVIISDVDMPVMNGLEFFNRASAEDPLIRDRFIFFTGALNGREFRFFTDQKLYFLEKPAGMTQIKRVVGEILSRSTRRTCATGVDGAVPLGCLEAFLISRMNARLGTGRGAAPDMNPL